ncbi:MAG: HAMP domain-containing sensor histidine kinase [Vicinamibacterales bacterium]|nr:HAMP domain-containing sensor histidine kinase [Vicinamibacterales bacterium]
MTTEDEARLLALLSHELRAPAGVVSGYLKLLAREAGLTERQQTLVQQAMGASEKLHGVLADLRDLLRCHEGALPLERRAVPLEQLAAEVAAAAATGPEAPSPRVGTLPNVVLQVDRARLTAALSAIVRAAGRPLGAAAVVHLTGTLDETPAVRLLIAPDGAGQDDAPVAALDESRGGQGLTLPLARAIIHAHAGTVTEQPQQAGAARFTVVLPQGPHGER